ncbi:MAG: ChaN family lipoprotein [Planctomycetota bacterium]
MGKPPDATPPPKQRRANARRELLAIQRRLYRRLQREIEALEDDPPPNVGIYQEEFERDVNSFEAVSSKAELVRAAADADVVYVGDYHSLPQAQRTVCKLLLALGKLGRPLVYCTELVHTPDQPLLDAYMSGGLSEEAFLREIHYERDWGFPWPPYRDAFEIARELGARVLAINSDPKEHAHDHLLERDFRAARVVVDAARAQPDALIVVFHGDFHVARDHLPLLVDSLLEQERLGARRRLIVHQNAEEIYWQLARKGLEDTNVVRLAADAYCVFNATPLEKLHSYLNWVSNRPALEPPGAGMSSWDLQELEEDDDDDDDDDLASDEGDDAFEDEDEDDDAFEDDDGQDLRLEYAEQVLEIVQTIAQFLEIEREDLDSFELFTVNDLDFLDYLATQQGFSEQERADVMRQILSNESYFIPKGRVIYLSDFSVVNAAEEGAHFLHHLCAAYDWERPRNLVTDFYFRAVTEALGYCGSKLIVPTRECWTEADCQAFVSAHRRRERERATRRRAQARGERVKGAPREEADTSKRLQVNRRLALRAARLTIYHRDHEREFLESGRWTSPGRALTQPVEVHMLLTHMLGHMLGNKLFLALLTNALEKERLREWFHAPLDKGQTALEVYLHMVEVTAKTPESLRRGLRL